MDAPPAVCNLGRVHLRIACHGIGSSTGPPSAGASHHPVDRRAVHGARDGEQGADSRAYANQGGSALLRSSGRAGHRGSLQDRLHSKRSHLRSAGRRWREGDRGSADSFDRARDRNQWSRADQSEEAPQRNQSKTQPAGERGTAGGSAPENH